MRKRFKTLAEPSNLFLDSPAVLGLAPLAELAAVFFPEVPLTFAGLAPFGTVGAEGRTAPIGARVGFLLGADTAATPTCFLGTTAAVVFDAVVVAAGFLPGGTAGLTSLTGRCELVPGLGLDPETPAEAADCVLLPDVLVFTLGSTVTGLPLVFGAAWCGALFADGAPSWDGTCSTTFSCVDNGSDAAATSAGSAVSMVTPSGFIPSGKNDETC